MYMYIMYTVFSKPHGTPSPFQSISHLGPVPQAVLCSLSRYPGEPRRALVAEVPVVGTQKMKSYMEIMVYQWYSKWSLCGDYEVIIVSTRWYPQ